MYVLVTVDEMFVWNLFEERGIGITDLPNGVWKAYKINEVVVMQGTGQFEFDPAMIYPTTFDGIMNHGRSTDSRIRSLEQAQKVTVSDTTPFSKTGYGPMLIVCELDGGNPPNPSNPRILAAQPTPLLYDVSGSGAQVLVGFSNPPTVSRTVFSGPMYLSEIHL